MESQQPGATMLTTQSQSLKQHWNPHAYQKRAIQLLLSQMAAGLFLDPGLGKTSTVLAAFKILKAKGMVKKMLIVAPLRPLYKVWPDEIKKWADFEGLTYAILHGDVKEHNLDCDVDIYLINPEGLKWLYAPERKRPQFDVLVLDESSMFKDSTTQRFRLLKPHLGSFKRRWILTGTPNSNGLLDLFGQIYILDFGRSLGRYITHYKKDYFRQGWNQYEWIPQHDAFERVVDKISPLVLQLSAEDYLAMPEVIYKNVGVTLPTEAMKVYTEVEDEYISGTIVAANAAVAGVKCRQVANGAVYDTERRVIEVHDEKLLALENILGELNGAPALVLYEFQHDADRIQKHIRGTEILRSGITSRQLENIIDKFNAGQIPVLLGHPASMGHGLNLQGSCHHVIWFGIPWNLEHYDQAIARVYRQGQKASHVFVYHLVAKGTIDERVLTVLTDKDRTQQNLLKALSDHRNSYYEGV